MRLIDRLKKEDDVFYNKKVKYSQVRETLNNSGYKEAFFMGKILKIEDKPVFQAIFSNGSSTTIHVNYTLEDTMEHIPEPDNVLWISMNKDRYNI